MAAKLDQPVEPDYNTSGIDPKKKKKSRKDKETSKDAEAESMEVIKKKEGKKRRKAEELEQEDGAAVTTDERKHRKRKKKTELAGEVETAEDTQVRQKKRKRHETEGVAVEAEAAVKATSDDLKERKKKRNKEKHDSQSTEETGEKRESKKKKRKHAKQGFKDPSGDESLSEQAAKALSYAYVHVSDPSSWKFNKARQNWLIRNILSEEAISADYAPLVYRYLSGIQGGARETLIQTCRTTTTDDSEPSSESAVAGSIPGEVTLEEKAAASKVSFQPTAKEQRAHDILAALTKEVKSVV